MPFFGHFRRLTSVQRNTFIACFLGWSLDAFDFFILTLCVNRIAAEFHASVSSVSEAIFLTLAMRPIGAFVFGVIADRIGRRPALMIDILAFSAFELSSAFAPSLKIFLITRALFGIAMGGEWGVGAALAFETLPAEGRGFFSGLLQEGYVVGNLFASLVFGLLISTIGWRGMFVVGALPALLVIYIRSKVDESPAWLQGRVSKNAERNLGKDIVRNFAPFVFLAILMFSLNLMSHGTQDLYPTFLERNLHFAPHSISIVVITYSLGALCGGIFFGSWSEKIGRRRAIVTAALLTLPLIPLWAYSRSVPMLALGGFLMQFMVQGAWGVIPAHLNELSPPAVRGTFPGFAYQVGNLLASRSSVLQAKLAEKRYGGSYPPIFAWTVVIAAALIATITWSGKERTGADLSGTNSAGTGASGN